MLIFRFVIFSGHDRFSGEASDTEEVQQENDVIAEHNDDKANNNAVTIVFSLVRRPVKSYSRLFKERIVDMKRDFFLKS